MKILLNTRRAGFYLALLAGFIFLAANLGSMEHEVIFMEGFPYRRDSDGFENDIDIGDLMETGDTVITEDGDFVELEGGGYSIKISENTVFSILELEVRGEKQDVLAALVGKLSFSRDRFIGNEPRLMTNSAICGVRGTNFALLAGIDGSSIIVVDEGLVEVAAAGAAVELQTGEGVEVETGAAPGPRFKALSKEIDFSTWNEQRLANLLENPVDAALRVETRMKSYIAEIKNIHPLYLETQAELEAGREKLRAIEDKDEASAYYKAEVFPVEQDITFRYVNIRYYALSALSLRRFVESRLYLTLKAKYITDHTNPLYQEFLEVHKRILGIYEEEVATSFLVIADI
jgi:hypothetical protein